MADADIRDALLAIADADAGGLLAPELYTDIAGFVRLDRFAGNMDLAMGTILAIVRSAARHGAKIQVRSWGYFRQAIAEDRRG